MFELDKQQFGAFVADQRKQKQMTQKDLAQKLMISDKAVSKWERGLNMPDITLLVPLAQALDVSVAELLECRKISQSEPMNANQVDKLVKKAITMSKEDPQVRKRRSWKNSLLLLLCFVVSLGEIGALRYFHQVSSVVFNDLLLMELLSVIFGLYFCLFAREKLPAYYDENKISSYSNGVFRMNLVGVYFNNRNWPQIMKAGRNWALSSLVLMPILYVFLTFLFNRNPWLVKSVLLLSYLAGLLIPMIYVGKKYE